MKISTVTINVTTAGQPEQSELYSFCKYGPDKSLQKMYMAVVESLSKKVIRGTFNSSLAPKAFIAFVSEAAKSYAKTYSVNDPHNIFSANDKIDVSRRLASEFENGE